MSETVVTYRRLVMPGDLNAANKLFGGTMMAWIDEAAALYAMCQCNNKHVVTAKISEIEFKKPVEQGDFLIFYATTKKVGTSSLTVDISVYNRQFDMISDTEPYEKVCQCEMVFVNLNPLTKKPMPHGLGVVKCEKCKDHKIVKEQQGFFTITKPCSECTKG